jgi:hypothetical protein
MLMHTAHSLPHHTAKVNEADGDEGQGHGNKCRGDGFHEAVEAADTEDQASYDDGG